MRAALWSVGLAAWVFLFFTWRSDLPAAVGIICAVLAVVCPATAEVRASARKQNAHRAEQRAWYAENFGSLDALRQAVDAPALRRIRDEKGAVHAVREVKRTHPRLPLDVAVSLVKGL
ncbi:hypothetical protein [Streptomyces sp. NPDC019224]|uniref:hypothetical protein n=1 Tax=Streptomyces sp. NPDC019224 TaxID=3154484 RepID=UPI0033F756F9